MQQPRNTVGKKTNSLEVPPQHDSLNLQATRAQLADERVADGADAELVAHGPDEHDAAGGQRALVAVLLGHEAQEAEDEEHGAQAHQAVEVQRAAADAEGHEEPGAEDADHVDGVLAQREGVGGVGWEACLLEEVAEWGGCVSWAIERRLRKGGGG